MKIQIFKTFGRGPDLDLCFNGKITDTNIPFLVLTASKQTFT